MNKNITVIASLFLALTFFLPTSSFALMIERSAEEIAQDAKVIIQGKVKSVRSYTGINGIIYTRASVLVSDVIKGKNIKKNITVEYEGGEVGPPRLSPHSEAGGEAGDIGVFVEDEQVLLFLTNSFWRKNVYYIVGGVSGKYAICPGDSVLIGCFCDKEDEAVVDEEEIQNSEEFLFMETENIDEAKQTLDELLGEIENAN